MDVSEIEVFKPQDILARFGVLSVISSTGSGKTVLIKDILSHVHKHFDHIFVFSKTAHLQDAYDFVDKSLIHKTLDEAFIQKIWNSQVDLKTNNKKMKNILIILDDIVTDKLMRTSKIILELFSAGRHINVSLFVLSHNYTSLLPFQRNNTSFFASFALDSQKERKNFCEQYLSINSLEHGTKMFNDITKEKKYQCIIVETHKNGATFKEKVRKYIADPNAVIPFIKNTFIEDREIPFVLNKRPPTNTFKKK